MANTVQINDQMQGSYIGSGGGGASGFTYVHEDLSGSSTGSNPTYTLAHTPTSDSQIELNHNGLILTFEGGDFTRVGAVLTLTTALPEATDTLLANYS
jgi:hypothetical protein